MILWLLLVIFICLILTCMLYSDLFRYISINNKTWNDVIRLDKKYKYISRVPLKDRTVISLTTIPSRLYKIAPTLCSLLDQTKRVDEIRLNIPYKTMKGQKYKIPKVFDQMTNVKIYRVEKDLGPSTKLLPTVRDESPKTNIIVVDDDMIYGKRLVETLVTSFKKWDEMVVISNYGCNTDDNSLNRIYKYIYGDKNIDLLFGCGGYILKAGMIPEDIFDYKSAPENAKYVDDNWISGWLWLNKIPINTLGMGYKNTFWPNLKSISTISLSGGVNHNSKNTKIVDKWFQQKYKDNHR